jgi:hypothetical protein
MGRLSKGKFFEELLKCARAILAGKIDDVGCAILTEAL